MKYAVKIRIIFEIDPLPIIIASFPDFVNCFFFFFKNT